MFAQNQKISLIQLKRLLVLELFSVSGIIIPKIAASVSGRDGAISIILASVYMLGFAFFILTLMKNMKGDYFAKSKESLGSILTTGVGLLYIFKYFLCCVFAVKLFSEVIKESLLPDTDNRIIMLLLILVSAYAASKGLEVRARIAEIVYFFVLIPILFFLFLGLFKVDYTNLMPILTEDVKTIMFGGYEIFLTFSVIELLLFVVPFIKYRERDKKKGRRLSVAVTKAVAIIGFLNLLFFVVSMGILGEKGTKETLWSMIYMIQVIKIPGGFIQRQDSIILSLWMLSIFTLLSGFLYYITVIGKTVFRVPNKNYLLIPFILFIFGMSVMDVETEEFYNYFSFYMKFIGIPQSIIIPLFIVLVDKLKVFIKYKSTALRGILILIFASSTFFFTGCKDKTEIEDRNFIQAMGIDYEEGNIKVQYILPDLKAQTGQETEEPESLILLFEGENFIRIEEEYRLQYNKKQDFSHLKAIILGNEFANHPNSLKEFTDYVGNKYELGKNTLIFLAKDTSEEIMKLNGDLEGGIGGYLEKLFQVNLANSDKEEVTLGDFVRGMDNQNEVVRIPLIKAKDTYIQTDGLAMLKDYFLKYTANDVEGDYIELTNGHGKDNRFFFYIEEKEYSMKLNNLQRKVDYNWNNQKPHVTILLKGKGKLEGKGKGDPLPSVETITEIFNQEVKNQILSQMEDILKGEGLDYLNLYRLSSLKNQKIWKAYREKENIFLKDISYELITDFYIE